ncbi:unnamed protein product [Durusdinium trenchii]|uniref:diacylglycerol O-acyltransferase n=1 Tax=Durusdinium trenchii TaxID=1381693 RepID=A0ABP0QZY1_9DINO
MDTAVEEVLEALKKEAFFWRGKQATKAEVRSAAEAEAFDCTARLAAQGEARAAVERALSSSGLRKKIKAFAFHRFRAQIQQGRGCGDATAAGAAQGWTRGDGTGKFDAATLKDPVLAQLQISKSAEVETRVAEKLTSDPQLTSGKLLVNGIAAVLMYMWCDLLGRPIYPLAAYIALLISPLRLGWSNSERCEVRSVISIYFFIFSAAVLPVWCLKRGGTWGRSLFAIYVSWYMFWDTAHLRGGRFMPTFRRRNFWKHFAAYFPMSLTRTAKLDPKRNYIFGYHPHGVISMGACCNFATEATGFSELFPGIDLRLLTLQQNFRIPVFREYLLGLGVNSVSKDSIDQNLKRCPGSSVMIVIGGARESLETAPGSYKLILENRKGFVKMALRSGASLVPVFSFGETDLFGVFASSRFRRLQLWLQKQMGFGIPFFFGRALTGGVLHRVFGLSRGVMPLRMPVQSIVGRPIYVEKPIANPTQEQVDELHQRYVNELRKIYEEWKEPFMEARAKIMESQGEAAKAVLRRGSFHLEKVESMAMVG